MGIDVHGLNFLRYANLLRNFENTITIGRQGLDVKEKIVREALNLNSNYKNDKYIENLLCNYFGSSTVDSIDNSNYEHASFIHDMNQPLPSNLQSHYDTVIDAGCLEHIYNVPQALKNCSLFCKPGGQIIHILPANNFWGHGFWQFSPELFFSLYSSDNGYTDTEVFLADLTNAEKWYKVLPPKIGQRVNVHSRTEVYVLVRTVLKGVKFSHNKVQQSDYIFRWTNSTKNLEEEREQASKTIKQKLKQSTLLYSLLSPLYHRYLSLKTNLSRSNPGLVEMKINSFF